MVDVNETTEKWRKTAITVKGRILIFPQPACFMSVKSGSGHGARGTQPPASWTL